MEIKEWPAWLIGNGESSPIRYRTMEQDKELREPMTKDEAEELVDELIEKVEEWCVLDHPRKDMDEARSKIITALTGKEE